MKTKSKKPKKSSKDDFKVSPAAEKKIRKLARQYVEKEASDALAKEFGEMREVLAEIDEEILFADGFEDALIGYVEIFSNTLALYDRAKCIDILMKRDKMTYDDAEDFFQFNVTGAYVGEKTPAFATFLRKAPK